MEPHAAGPTRADERRVHGLSSVRTKQNALRVCFVLPGLHCVSRGAESMFESLGQELAKDPAFHVTLIGAGPELPHRQYRYLQAISRMRESFSTWPRIPPLRNAYRWEELSFASRLSRVYSPKDYDCTITCSYPFVNWWLRATRKKCRPAHIFVTQNGDWPARRTNGEYRFFDCDGLVCTNPEFYRRNSLKWNTALIPNGVDVRRFSGVREEREVFGIPNHTAVVLMAGALVPQKRIKEGIALLKGFSDLFLLIVGDGPMRAEIQSAAEASLPGRWKIIQVPFESMPSVYASADLLLHMALDESFGNIYIEALAAGLPVVAHDSELTRWIFGHQLTESSGGCAEFAHVSIGSQAPGSDAWLVDTTMPGNVIHAVQSALLSRSSRESRLNTLANRYCWATVSGKYAAFVRKVVEGV